MRETAEKLDFGSVLITDGDFEGQHGYYDNDEFDPDLDKEMAVVYLDSSTRAEYVLLDPEYLTPIISLKHEKEKRGTPGLTYDLGI